MGSQHERIAPSGDGQFPMTRWTLILEARGEDPQALAELCGQYWKPLYVYARRKGSDPHEAEDLTQSFFLHVLSNDVFQGAEKERGRLRSLLLRSFQNFMSNEWRKRRTAKRGGDVPFVEIDTQPAESWVEDTLAEGVTPELEFERSWARELLERARLMLHSSYVEGGKLHEFEAFADQLDHGKSERSYREIAEELGVEEPAARFIGFKLRQRYREFLEELVTATVSSRSEAAEELKHLLTVFSDQR